MNPNALDAELNLLSIFSKAHYGQITALRTVVEALMVSVATYDPALAEIVSINVKHLAEEKREHLQIEEETKPFDLVIEEVQKALLLLNTQKQRSNVLSTS